MLYKNTNHTHTHKHTHKHTHTHTHSIGQGDGQGCENSLEIIIKQVHLEGGFERGSRIRVVERLRQTVPDRQASIKKKEDLSPNVFVCTRGSGGDKSLCVRCRL